MESPRYSATDYLEGLPVPPCLVQLAVQFTVVDLEDVGLVGFASETPEDADDAERDPTSRERLELGLPLSFGNSRVASKHKKPRLASRGAPEEQVKRGRAEAEVRTEFGRRLFKYWLQRYSLFSKFDQGVQVDREGWYSTTPECMARHHAQKCSPDGGLLILDGCCGVGGNAIQFAVQGNSVMAVDNHSTRLSMAQHNARIYKVDDRIEFVLGDVFQVARGMKPDLLFLSPPWGGPRYLYQDYFCLEEGSELDRFLERVRKLVLSWETRIWLVLFLPRNIDLCALARKQFFRARASEVEVLKVNGIVKAVTVYLNEMY